MKHMDSELEQNILGNILLEITRLYRFEGIEEKHFAWEFHQKIFRLINELESNRSFEMSTLYHLLQGEERVSLMDIVEKSLPGIDFEGSSKLLIELWENRESLKYLQQQLTLLHTGKANARTIFEEIGKQQITHIDKSSSGGWLSDCMLECAEEIRHSSPIHKVKTELYWLDEVIGGFEAADLCVIGGLTGKGKTALATTLAYTIASKQKPVLFFSMEMKKSQLAFRIISRLRNKPTSTRNSNSYINKEDLADEIVKLGKRNTPEFTSLWIDDTPNLSFTKMRQKALRFKNQHGLDCVIVDFLTLMQTESNKDNRVQELDKMIYQLKGLAKELDMVVIVLAQLSREAERLVIKKNGNSTSSRLPEPHINHLRESGGIGFAADFILFVHDPSEQDTGEMPPSVRTIEIVVAKNRFGKTGKTEFRFNGPLTLIENLR